MSPAKSVFSLIGRENHKINQLVRRRRYSTIPRFTPRPYHSSLIKTGSIHFPHVANYLLKLYLKGSGLECAEKLFDEIHKRDVVTWTILISGLSKYGSHRIALDYFTAMRREGSVLPNVFTLSSVLKCCASLCDGLRIGKAVHGWIVTNGIEVDVALDNAVLDLYSKFKAFGCVSRFFDMMDDRDSTSWNIVMAAKISEGKMEESLDLFWRLPEKSISSWNTVVDGLIQQGLEGRALELLHEMVRIGNAFNEVSFSTSLALASKLKDLELGKQIHCRILRIGMDEDSVTSTSLLDMYCKCRAMHKATVVFKELQIRFSEGGEYNSMAPTVTWSTMIAGCVQNGRTEDALSYFRSMILNKHKIDLYTLTTIITASADEALLELGQQIHAHTLKLGCKQNAYLCPSMIDMYAKCGKIDDSWSYFKESRTRNVVLWSAMISSYAMHGLGNEAIKLFEMMRNEGVKPNEISFLGLLTGCSHAGLVEEGCKYFKMMVDVYRLQPGIEHFASMIDLLGRAGHLKEIKDFVYESGVDHVKEVWKTYLSSCWLHKDVEMTNWVSEKLLELDPGQRDPYLTVSNTYSANEVWEEAARFRGLMMDQQVNKLPGVSWI